MRYLIPAAIAALVATTNAASLADLCTTSHVQSALPGNGTLLGISLIPSSVTASALYNQTVGSSGGPPSKKRQAPTSSTSSASYSYCNVNLTYTHPGRGDTVKVTYAFPDPSIYKNRFYVAGGEGYSLSTSTTGGLEYGAASGATDAGYGALSGVGFDDVALLGNGTVNWENTYMFGYEALGEMTSIGKVLTAGFYGSKNATKLYTYYEGCSDGGRQGMSQIQRWGEEYDGAVIGAPAFRYAQQQTNHIFSSVVEHTMDYYPPPCALDKIVNATIKACDPLDGKTDGVISRSDLCQLHFNLSSVIGESYYCAAVTSTSLGFGFNKVKRQAGAAGSQTSYQPAQNGTVNAQDVAVAQAIYNGLHNSQGERAYLSWQIGSELSDAETQWSNSTNSWQLDITSLGGEYVAKFVERLDLDNLSTLDGVTYDTVVEWMTTAYYRYLDSLQTTIPDLSTFQGHGGKLLHYHGESDPSVPAASSVHYWQSVREIMYGISPNDSTSNPLSDWYQFYLVPGAAHCGSNTLQPDGPFPENNMNTIIDWVEHGIQPQTLNATASENPNEKTWELCQWPLRPLWKGNQTAFECVEDEESYLSWTYEFAAFKVPIY